MKTKDSRRDNWETLERDVSRSVLVWSVCRLSLRVVLTVRVTHGRILSRTRLEVPPRSLHLFSEQNEVVKGSRWIRDSETGDSRAFVVVLRGSFYSPGVTRVTVRGTHLVQFHTLGLVGPKV